MKKMKQQYEESLEKFSDFYQMTNRELFSKFRASQEASFMKFLKKLDKKIKDKENKDKE